MERSPTEEVTADALIGFVEQGWTVTQIATHYGKSPRTIFRWFKKFNISVKGCKYTDISRRQLKREIEKQLEMGHEYGENTIDSNLRDIGITVQRKRIRAILREINPPEVRAARRIVRRKYWVLAPLSLIHLDGYHKLVTWRWVIHGAIDGFSRRIFFLGVSDNNRASTVLKLFKQAVYQYGLPSRIRIDKGKENIGVVHYMLHRRGPGRRSVMAGRSVHNTRIERLWLDVKQRCTGPYRNRFIEMENSGILDHKNETDLYCLHMIFGPLLKKSVNKFFRTWNIHKSRSLRSKSPTWVFQQGILRLKVFARQQNRYFVELDQRNWPLLDEQERNALPEYEDNEGIFVPRIRCPVTDHQNRAVKNAVRRDTIDWGNSVAKYLELRHLVMAMMERNENDDASD